MSNDIQEQELKPTERHVELVGGGGLKCDNSNCDYTNEEIKIEDYEIWVDKPCPKCSENLLTKEDYDNLKGFLAIKDFINSLSKEELDSMVSPLKDANNISPNQKVVMTFNTHKGISLDKIEEVK